MFFWLKYGIEGAGGTQNSHIGYTSHSIRLMYANFQLKKCQRKPVHDMICLRVLRLFERRIVRFRRLTQYFESIPRPFPRVRNTSSEIECSLFHKMFVFVHIYIQFNRLCTVLVMKQSNLIEHDVVWRLYCKVTHISKNEMKKTAQVLEYFSITAPNINTCQ